MTSLRYGLLYFLIVFGAGFLLAPLRELLLAPRVGPMWAELLEMPLMLVVIVLAARWLARRPAFGKAALKALGSGVFALALMLLAEYSVMLFVRQLTFAEYVEQREAVSGTVYLLMLGLFAVLPWWFARRSNKRSE